MKTCTKCQVEKNYSEFTRDKSRLDGYEYVCKSCKKKRSDKYIAGNKLRIKKYSTAWYKQNKERVKNYGARYRASNKDTVAEKDSARNVEYARNNPDKVAEKCGRRRASKKQRTPPWLTKKHIEEMRGFYRLAKEMEKETGVKHHVDHIIPLQGETVSGLHVPWNLQVLTASDNSRKGNKI